MFGSTSLSTEQDNANRSSMDTSAGQHDDDVSGSETSVQPATTADAGFEVRDRCDEDEALTKDDGDDNEKIDGDSKLKSILAIDAKQTAVANHDSPDSGDVESTIQDMNVEENDHCSKTTKKRPLEDQVDENSDKSKTEEQGEDCRKRRHAPTNNGASSKKNKTEDATDRDKMILIEKLRNENTTLMLEKDKYASEAKRYRTKYQQSKRNGLETKFYRMQYEQAKQTIDELQKELFLLKSGVTLSSSSPSRHNITSIALTGTCDRKKRIEKNTFSKACPNRAKETATTAASAPRDSVIGVDDSDHDDDGKDSNIDSEAEECGHDDESEGIDDQEHGDNAEDDHDGDDDSENDRHDGTSLHANNVPLDEAAEISQMKLTWLPQTRAHHPKSFKTVSERKDWIMASKSEKDFLKNAIFNGWISAKETPAQIRKKYPQFKVYNHDSFHKALRALKAQAQAMNALAPSGQKDSKYLQQNSNGTGSSRRPPRLRQNKRNGKASLPLDVVKSLAGDIEAAGGLQKMVLDPIVKSKPHLYGNPRGTEEEIKRNRAVRNKVSYWKATLDTEAWYNLLSELGITITSEAII